jgi:hypothetical protein
MVPTLTTNQLKNLLRVIGVIFLLLFLIRFPEFLPIVLVVFAIRMIFYWLGIRQYLPWFCFVFFMSLFRGR